MELIIVLAAVIIITPFALRIASKQDKDAKNKLRAVFQVLLLGELLSGFFNWETFTGAGRSGYALALAYPASLFWLFFALAAGQIILLISNKTAARAIAVILGFVNSVLFFVGTISVSNTSGRQAVGYAGVAAIFLVLIGNVVGLLLANKDKTLLAKWPYR